ncbi:MAG: hypothetical protein IPK61_03335 [Saprospiraceae bacterium]|nr:hypothetical protein [Saprospiraceae bacterium]
MYESYRKNINRIAEGIFSDIIEDEKGKAYFGSVAWSLDPKELYSYTFLSKVDKGDMLNGPSRFLIQFRTLHSSLDGQTQRWQVYRRGQYCPR